MSKRICDLEAIEVKIGEIEDIERNGYNFTDGVGNISPRLAQEVAANFGYKYSSAF